MQTWHNVCIYSSIGRKNKKKGAFMREETILTVVNRHRTKLFSNQARYSLIINWVENYTSTCNDCGEIIEQNDVVYIPSIDACVCETCLSRHYSHCNDCGDYFPNNRGLHDDHVSYCENCQDNYCRCDDCGSLIYSNDVYVNDNGCYCQYCYIADDDSNNNFYSRDSYTPSAYQSDECSKLGSTRTFVLS